MLFSGWNRAFEARRSRPRPRITDTSEIPPSWRAPLASSLARFQLGETGEGRIVADVRRAAAEWGVPADYVAALASFIAEEGRHAAILGTAVTALGGRSLSRAASAIAFAKVRRLGGPRLELAVLLGAEVAALAFYGVLVERLPAGQLRDALHDIAKDEGVHLLFHIDFFRAIAAGPTRRAAVAHAWAIVGVLAGVVVALDHRRTLRRMGSRPLLVVRRAVEIARWTVDALTTPADPREIAPDDPCTSHPVAPIAAGPASGS